MESPISRRSFVKGSTLASTGAALALGSAAASTPETQKVLLKGKLGDMEVSRLLLGGNRLTHYTHSRNHFSRCKFQVAVEPDPGQPAP